ncbi:MAG: hypothetical protein WCT08_04590 [Patescibacteria group bacterium]
MTLGIGIFLALLVLCSIGIIIYANKAQAKLKTCPQCGSKMQSTCTSAIAGQLKFQNICPRCGFSFTDTYPYINPG